MGWLIGAGDLTLVVERNGVLVPTIGDCSACRRHFIAEESSGV